MSKVLAIRSGELRRAADHMAERAERAEAEAARLAGELAESRAEVERLRKAIRASLGKPDAFSKRSVLLDALGRGNIGFGC